MASRIRKLASETAIYGLSSVLGRAVNFLLFPFYSQVLDPAEYGPVIVVYAAFVFLNIVYQYGTESAYMKFASVEGADRTAVFSTSVWSLTVSAALFSTALWFLQDAAAPVIGLEPDMAYLLGFAAAILFLDTTAVVPFAELRLSNRPMYFAVVRLTSVGVNVGGNLLLILGAGMGVEAILLANVASSATTLLLLAPVLIKHTRPTFNRPLWKEMLLFGLPFLPGGLGYAITERVNIFFLSRMPSETVVGLYGDSMSAGTLAAVTGDDPGAAGEFVVGVFGGMVKLAVLAALAVQMFRFAWQPFFLNHARDEDAPELFARVFLLLTAGLFGLVLTVSFFAAELVAIPLPGGRTLVDSSYWVGLTIIPAALIGYAFQGWYYHFSSGAYITKKTAYFVPSTLIGSAVALTVNFFAVPVMGMLGAVWATTASYAVMALVLLALVGRHYPVPYSWGRIGMLVTASLGLLALWSWQPDLQIWWMELGLLAAYAGVSGATLASGFRRAES